MDFGVDRSRRRPDSRRLLIYPDTSTFRHLAEDFEGSERLRRVLLDAVAEERAICVASPFHDDELTAMGPGPRLDQATKTVRSLTLGLRMKFDEELTTNELVAAAEEFGGARKTIPWDEAFQNDPESPPLNPYMAEYLDRLEHPSALVDEVAHERATSAELSAVNAELRSKEFDFETVASANLDARVKWLLGPRCEREFLHEAQRRQNEVVESWKTGAADMAAGSPMRRYARFAHVAFVANSLAERFPTVAADPSAFCASDAVRELPLIRIFAFVLAALGVDGRRVKPSLSDLHDVWHLTYGLSRRDVVTADRRSCELVRRRDLLPADVILVEGHRLEDLAEAVTSALGA